MEKSRDRQVVVDVESGQVSVMTKLGGKERTARGAMLKPNTGFVMVWPEEMRQLGLTRVQSEALYLLMQMMDPRTGAVQFVAEQIREDLGQSSATVVSRTIRQLIERGALRRVPHTRNLYAINPRAAWNGKAQERSAAIFAWDQLEAAAS